jgi:hypothetical protein
MLLHARLCAAAIAWAFGRKAIAAICALSLFSVGLAHAIDNANEPAPISSIVFLKSPADQTQQQPSTVLPCDHCFCCTGATFEPLFVAAVVSRIESEFVALPIPALHSHDPTLQTPPPKTLI